MPFSLMLLTEPTRISCIFGRNTIRRNTHWGADRGERASGREQRRKLQRRGGSLSGGVGPQASQYSLHGGVL